MARAASVWLVMKRGYPLAVFTVRWELVKWLKKKLETYNWSDSEINIIKMHDSKPDVPKQYFSMKEILGD